MTILTDISKPETVRAVEVQCDRCGRTTTFPIEVPSDLWQRMLAAGWSMPTEGRPNYCGDGCAIRM